MKTITIKIGGRAASNKEALDMLINEISELKSLYNFIFVHGGGAEVSRVTKVFGYEPVFKDGIRQTSEEEMEIVDMVLSGLMNKKIVRQFYSKGVKAVGLSGNDGAIFTGESISKRTGKITNTNPELIKTLLKDNYLPVISSTSMDDKCEALNINADEAGFEVASSIPSDLLIFISDIPGILKDGEVIKSINEKDINSEIENGTISGGMIPKVRSSLLALKKGVKEIIIGDYKSTGDLSSLINKTNGSHISV